MDTGRDGADLNQAVEIMPVRFDPVHIRRPSADLLAFVKKLRSEERDYFHEQRRARRHPLGTLFSSVVLDEKFQPAGEQFLAVTLNISSGGLCIIHDRAIPEPYIALEICAKGIETSQFVLKILRRTGAGKFFKIAGRFVHKIT